ncbi:MAG: cytochrome c biogenesis protein ResB [Chloroflexi bacterium]|nr:cytochrome c biogenesis protein ResB [Chloroflexota bacterium]
MSESTGEVEVRTEAKSDPIDGLWRFFSSTKTAIVLILLVAFASFMGSLIPQVPASYAMDPVSYAQWLAAMREKFGAVANIYDALGLFNVYNVFWFKLLLIILIFSTIICTINRLPALWNPVFSPRIKVSDGMFRAAAIRTSIKARQKSSGRGIPQPVKGIAETVFSTLSSHRYKVFVEQGEGTTHFYADRNGIFKLGTLMTHLSLVILMVGAVMGGMFGFSDDGVVIPEGKTYNVGFGENFSIRADQFKAEFYPDGQPKDYWSDLVVIEGGKEVAKQRIRVNEPLEYKGVRFHQSFYGPALAVEVKDGQERTVFSDVLPLVQSSGQNAAGWVSLPGTDVALVASLPFGGDATRPATVQLFKGQVPTSRDTLRPGETKSIGNYQINYKGLKSFTGLRMVKDPGVPVVWLACTLLVVGICVTLYFPRRRIWGRVTAQEVVMAGTADRTVNFRPEFDRIVEAIRRV